MTKKTVGKPLHGTRPKQHLIARIDPDLIDRVRAYRAENKTPASQIAEQALKEFLDRRKK